jgi:hypothetical protein
MPTVQQINAFVGLPYEEGRFDCADLAVKIQRDLYGKHIGLPAHHPQGAKTQAAAIRRNSEELATRITREEAMDGDAIVIVSTDGEGGTLLHIGTLFYLSSIPWVLHTSVTTGHSLLQRLSDLPLFRLKVEGFYRWK